MSCVVDTSGLSKATAERLKFPGRTEAEVLNRAAYSVSANTLKNMPFASGGKIDTELKVTANHFITKKGTLSKGKRKSFGRGDRNAEATLVALIVAARANPGSNFNARTNSRFALGKNPFKGVSRAAGAAAMKALVNKMIKARHSSSHFLQSGWIPAIKKLFPFKSGSPSNPPTIDSNSDQRGDAIPAKEGSWTAFASIENATGLKGVQAARVNDALLKYGTAPLQAAIDQEEVLMLRYMEEKTQKQNDRFNAMCR